MFKSQKEGKECCESDGDNWNGYHGRWQLRCKNCKQFWYLKDKIPLCSKEPQKEDHSMGMSSLRCCDNGDIDEKHDCLKQKQGTGWEGEKYGIWKIISEMLDHPIDSGIYHTSKCYKEIDSVIDILVSRAEQAGYEKERQRIETIIELESIKFYTDHSYDNGYTDACKKILSAIKEQ